MKVVLSVRSNVAFNYLDKLIEKEDSLPDFEVRSQNAMNVRDLEDAIEFYNADVYVIDMNLGDSQNMIDILSQADLPYIAVREDIKNAMPLLIEKYGVVEEKADIHYEHEEREKIVIQEKIIEKEIIRTKYKAIPSKVVIVGSLYRGAGSTLLAANLARMVAKRGVDVSYVEHPLIKPYMFDYLQIIEEAPNYVDVSMSIKVDGVSRAKSDSFQRDGINWHVIDSRKPLLTSFSYEELLVLSHSIQSSVMIIDISDRWLDPEIQKYLFLADSILLCVEPDPIKYDRSIYTTTGYIAKEKQIMDFLTSNLELSHFDMVLMKNVKGIDAKTVRGMLHKKPITTFPYIPYQDIQKALFKSKVMYDFENYSADFEENLITVIAKVLPKEYIELEHEGDNIFTKVINVFKK